MKQKRKSENKEKSVIGRFLERKDIVFSAKRYGIDALGAMAFGLLQIVDSGLQVCEVSGQDGRCDLCHN